MGPPGRDSRTGTRGAAYRNRREPSCTRPTPAGCCPMPRTRWDARLQEVEADITDIKIRLRPSTRCAPLQHGSGGETVACVRKVGGIVRKVGPMETVSGCAPVHPRILPPRVQLGKRPPIRQGARDDDGRPWRPAVASPRPRGADVHCCRFHAGAGLRLSEGGCRVRAREGPGERIAAQGPERADPGHQPPAGRGPVRAGRGSAESARGAADLAGGLEAPSPRLITKARISQSQQNSHNPYSCPLGLACGTGVGQSGRHAEGLSGRAARQRGAGWVGKLSAVRSSANSEGRSL
jgi:hypothetical protein